MHVERSRRLARLAELLRSRNETDREIAALIGRPAEKGHVGEFLAAELFGIDLHESAVHAGSDGVFRTGPWAGRTVNIKWYAKCEGLLDLATNGRPDFYLVLAGPRSCGGTSRGGHRPWLIESVHLFDAAEVHADLERRGVKIGVASSVCRELWDAAEVWPRARSAQFGLAAGVGGVLGMLRGVDDSATQRRC